MAHAPLTTMHRFYAQADVTDVDGGHGIALDGRAVRTPQRRPLILPSAELAHAVAAEWQAQGDKINPSTMPLTGLANAAIDLAAPDPAAFAAPLVAYAETDLFCYRDARDAVLAARQVEQWNPMLAWAEAHFSVEFRLASGIMHVAQPPATVARLADAVHALDPFRLAALAPLVTISGSLVAGLAVATAAHDARALWPVVILDELFQEERWGADAQATAQRARHEAEFLNAARFVTLLE